MPTSVVHEKTIRHIKRFIFSQGWEMQIWWLVTFYFVFGFFRRFLSWALTGKTRDADNVWRGLECDYSGPSWEFLTVCFTKSFVLYHWNGDEVKEKRAKTNGIMMSVFATEHVNFYTFSFCMWSTNLRFGIVICAILRLFFSAPRWMNWMFVIVTVGFITKWYLSLSHGRVLVSIKICHVRGSGEACLIAGKNGKHANSCGGDLRFTWTTWMSLSDNFEQLSLLLGNV